MAKKKKRIIKIISAVLVLLIAFGVYQSRQLLNPFTARLLLWRYNNAFTTIAEYVAGESELHFYTEVGLSSPYTDAALPDKIEKCMKIYFDKVQNKKGGNITKISEDSNWHYKYPLGTRTGAAFYIKTKYMGQDSEHTGIYYSQYLVYIAEENSEKAVANMHKTSYYKINEHWYLITDRN